MVNEIKEKETIKRDVENYVKRIVQTLDQFIDTNQNEIMFKQPSKYEIPMWNMLLQSSMFLKRSKDQWLSNMGYQQFYSYHMHYKYRFEVEAPAWYKEGFMFKNEKTSLNDFIELYLNIKKILIEAIEYVRENHIQRKILQDFLNNVNKILNEREE